MSGEEGVAKPDLAIIREAPRRCGCDLGESTWLVGDDPRADIPAAVSAGIRCIWLAKGREWPDCHVGPNFTAEELPDALDVLLNQAQ
ncbi:MAG: HAD hydrolase-like protein [Dehalococcoidia bacterium]|nr:HAD hydrolase-like protein [Dehalococcoidia bacterium]